MRHLRLLRISPDLAVFVVGLALFALGLGLWWLPAAPIGAGAVLMAVSVFGGGK